MGPFRLKKLSDCVTNSYMFLGQSLPYNLLQLYSSSRSIDSNINVSHANTIA